MAPWVSAHFSVQKNVLPCCIYKMDTPFGNLSETENVFDIYNSEVAKYVRKSLFEGKKIKECNECWVSEEISNNESYRENHNLMFGQYTNDVLDNTNDDFSLKQLTLKKLDIRFDNKCNLKCRMCNSDYSTSWYKEQDLVNSISKNKYFSHLSEQDKAFKSSVPTSVYDFIVNQLPNIDEIFFAGGEPLIQEKHYYILEKAIEMGISKNITLTYNTNFSKLNWKEWDCIELWKKFKKVSVSASLDGSYARGEYIRKNLKWNSVITNVTKLNKVIELYPHISFGLIPTLSIMNAYNIVDFHKEWLELRYIKPDHFFVNMLHGPDYYCIKNLPEEYKLELTNLYQNHINWMNANSHLYGDMYISVHEFEKIINFMNMEGDMGKLHGIIDFTESLDTIRNEDFLKTFPEYKELFNIINNFKWE